MFPGIAVYGLVVDGSIFFKSELNRWRAADAAAAYHAVPAAAAPTGTAASEQRREDATKSDAVADHDDTGGSDVSSDGFDPHG